MTHISTSSSEHLRLHLERRQSSAMGKEERKGREKKPETAMSKLKAVSSKEVYQEAIKMFHFQSSFCIHATAKNHDLSDEDLKIERTIEDDL